MKRIENILVLFLFLSSVSIAQSFLSWEKGLHLVSSASAGVFSGYADHTEVLKWTNGNSVYYDDLAHKYRSISRGSFVIAGGSIVLSSRMEWKKVLADLALTIVYQGVFHNASQNWARDKNTFWQTEYQEKYNTSGWEDFASAGWQISAFIVVTIINFLIYRVIK